MFLPQPQMVRVHELFDLILDRAGIGRNVVFREELLLFVIVDLIISD
jgi:hypothetical protein